MSETKHLENFYKNIDEENRFQRSKAHTIEFITTTKYIEKYLKPGDRILEVGAATGAYSLHYASKGFQVDAIELVEHNIEIFKKKIEDKMNINVTQGNALDLSIYEDNTFDVTLVLGPLYHLYTEEDNKKAISEAIRVTKKSGYIFIAYLTHGSIMLNYGLRKGNLLDIPRICDEEYRFKSIPEEIFTGFYVDEFEKLMEKFNHEYIGNIATNGISLSFRETVDELSEEEFNIWLDYHLKTCERKDIQGYSSHMLYIAKKA